MTFHPMRCRGCGHSSPARPSRREVGGTVNPTQAELMDPARLTALLIRRPDLADQPLLGARLAASITEGA